jgi:hypothetical protein
MKRKINNYQNKALRINLQNTKNKMEQKDNNFLNKTNMKYVSWKIK